MTNEVRHLGTIEGREIPGPAEPPPTPSSKSSSKSSSTPPPPPPPPSASAPSPPGAPNFPPPTGAPIQPPHPGAPPTAGRDLVPYQKGQPPRSNRASQAKAEVVEALHDIRDAHRRGPKENSRALPHWVERMAWVLDDAIEIPATGGRRVGIDGFITIVPGIGDAVGVALSMVVVTAGVLAGASWPTIVRMLINVAFEGVVGLIPFAGVVFDLAYKANDRNVRLIEADLADRKGTRRSSLAVLAALAFTTIAGLTMMFVLSVLGITFMVWFTYRLIRG